MFSLILGYTLLIAFPYKYFRKQVFNIKSIIVFIYPYEKYIGFWLFGNVVYRLIRGKEWMRGDETMV